MKKLLIKFAILISSVLCLWANSAISQPFPEKPVARLGKGSLNGELAYSPDGSLLAVAGSLGVWLYDAKDLTEVGLLEEEGHTTGVTALALSPSENMLASAGQDQTVRLWDVQEKKQLAVLKHKDIVLAVTFSPDGKTLASAGGRGVMGDKTIWLWDVQAKRRIAILAGHTDHLTCLAFSPDGKILASGGDDLSVRLWDVEKERQVATLVGHTSWMSSVAFSPDGKTLASGSNDGTVRLWNVQEKKQLAVLKHIMGVSFLAFSPSGKILAAGRSDTIWLWDVRTQKQIVELKDYTNLVSALAFSPDGKILALGGDGVIRLCGICKNKSQLGCYGDMGTGCEALPLAKMENGWLQGVMTAPSSSGK